MKKLHKMLLLSMLTVAMFIGVATVNQTRVYAYAYTTVYLEVGETYKQTTTNTEPIFTCASNLKGTGYDSKGVKVCDAEWNTATLKKRTYFTITAKNEGVATFYVNRLNSKKDDDRVRTVKVRVFKKGTAPDLQNSISHAESDKKNFTNQQIYTYAGNSFTVTSVPKVALPSDVSEDTSKKAVKASLHIYECDNNGNTLTNDKKKLSAGSSLNGSTLRFTSNATSSATSTYVRASYKWTTSNGNIKYSVARILKVNIYPKPTLGIYQNGKGISSLSMVMGSTEDVNMSVANIQTGDVLSKQSCVVQDKTKVSVSNSRGVWTIKPLTITNNIPVKLTFSCVVTGIVSNHNGEDYMPLNKVITININTLKSVRIVGELYGNNQVRVSWNKNEDAGSYLVYRSETEQGEYKKIGTTKDLFMVDDDNKLEYNKTYYYKVCVVGKDGKAMSDFSNISAVKIALKTPRIKSVTRSGKYYLVEISGTHYSGYEIYIGNNRRVLASTEADTVNIKLGSGTNLLCVRAFFKNEKSGEKVYSDYSSIYKLIIDDENKPTVKNDEKVKVQKPTIITLKKVHGKKKKTKSKTYVKIVMAKRVKDYNADGYEIYLSKSKNFKSCKFMKVRNKNLKKKTIKIKKARAKYYVKIRAYKVVNNKKIYSDFTKTKSVTKISKK